MKNPGDKNDFTELKEKEIYNTFLLTIAGWQGYIDMPAIYSTVSLMPASRFFVSLPRAVKVIRAMAAGAMQRDDLSKSRRRMYAEIYRRVMKQLPDGFSIPVKVPKNGRDKSNRLFRAAVATVIRQPAPEFYTDIEHIRKIIKRKHKEAAAARLAYFKDRQRRLSFCCTKINNK